MKRTIVVLTLALTVLAVAVGKSKQSSDVMQDKPYEASTTQPAQLGPAPSPAIFLTPDEQEKSFEQIAASVPKAKLKELKAEFASALKAYDARLAEYEQLERLVAKKLLASRDPSHDRDLERLNDELKKKFAALRAENENVNKASAKFNVRLLAVANEKFAPGKAR